jgi:acyl carrier protein
VNSATTDFSDPISQRLQEIFREVFAEPDLVLTATMTAADVPGWDSLGHVGLMFSIEAAFGVTFTERELSTLDDVGQLRDVLLRKLS